MAAHKAETTVGKDHTVTVKGLPFEAGQAVEVIVIPKALPITISDWRSLRGSVIRYENPTEPVSEDDWDALK